MSAYDLSIADLSDNELCELLHAMFPGSVTTRVEIGLDLVERESDGSRVWTFDGVRIAEFIKNRLCIRSVFCLLDFAVKTDVLAYNNEKKDFFYSVVSRQDVLIRFFDSKLQQEVVRSFVNGEIGYDVQLDLFEKVKKGKNK